VNEPSNYEMLILTLMAASLVIGVYLVVRFLDPRVKKWASRTAKKRELLEERYSAYSIDDLFQLLQHLEGKNLLETMALLNVAEKHIEDERIRILIQQLQTSKVLAVKMRAKSIIQKWVSEAKS
jgi:hypothetical protein